MAIQLELIGINRHCQVFGKFNTELTDFKLAPEPQSILQEQVVLSAV